MKTVHPFATSLAAAALTASAFAQVSPRQAPPVQAQQPEIKTFAPPPTAVGNAADEIAARGTAGASLSSAPAKSDAAAEASAAPPALRGINFDVVRYQDGPDGALWARGRTYKARFDGQSATVIPYFSPRAPRNFDVRFELESVSASDVALRLDDEARVHREGDLVTLDHGSVDEQYVLGVEVIEQRFVLDALPAAGDLRVQLSVATELSGTEHERGFEFANEWGQLSYGRATAIDAGGRSLLLESNLIDGMIEIVVPESFTAGAALPLTIDPVVTIFGVDTTSTTAFNPDSSYDWSGGGVLHVYNVVFSANDWDVGGYATDRWGNVWSPSFFWNDFTAAHWVRPRVAHNGATDRFLVCAQVGQPGSRAIWGQVRTVWSNSLMAPAIMAPMDFGEVFNVDVGGDPFPALPSFFCIAYERAWAGDPVNDHDVLVRLIDTNGVPASSPGTIYLANTGGTKDALPSVSKSNREASWNIAWQQDVIGQPTKIHAARVFWNGAITAAPFLVSVTSLPERRPSVSSSIAGTNSYMIACERDFTSDNDIVLYPVDHAAVQPPVNLSGYDGTFLFQNQIEPSIDSDGAHFLAAWSEQYANIPSDYDLYSSEVQWITSGVSVRQNRMNLAYTSAYENELQVVSAESSNPAQNAADYTTVFRRGVDVATAGPTDDIIAALVVGTYGGLMANFCRQSDVDCPCGDFGVSSGCPNSATAFGAHIVPANSSSTTNDQLIFNISGLKPSATALLFQGTGTINGGFGNTLGDGVRCVGGLIKRFAASPADGFGSLSYPLPGAQPISIEGGVPLMGGLRYYQVWFRDTAAYCTSGLTNLSDALMVEWTP